MSPPIVWAVTNPSSHRISKMATMVSSMFGPPFFSLTAICEFSRVRVTAGFGLFAGTHKRAFRSPTDGPAAHADPRPFACTDRLYFVRYRTQRARSRGKINQGSWLIFNRG